MERLKNLWKIIKKCHLEKIFVTYFICFFAASFIVWRVDPAFHSFRDALWYFFVASTSIGFGDETVTTATGRTLTVFITYYQLFLFAALSGVVVTHYMNVLQAQEKKELLKDRLQNKSTAEVVEQLSTAMHTISGRLSYISSMMDTMSHSSQNNTNNQEHNNGTTATKEAQMKDSMQAEINDRTHDIEHAEMNDRTHDNTKEKTMDKRQNNAILDNDKELLAPDVSFAPQAEMLNFLDVYNKLQHLTEMSPEELKALEDRFKNS